MAQPRHTIEITIDWGTGHTTTAYAKYDNGVRVSELTTLLIDGIGYEEPAMAAWLGDEYGTFCHGFALQALANNNASISDRIMTLFKLPLSTRPGALEVTGRVEDVLAEEGKTYDQLLEEHLRAVVKNAKRDIRTMESNLGPHKLTVQQLDSMLDSLRVRITVPDSWTPNARHRMQSAAEQAGLQHVVLASESKAVIAYLVDKVAREVANPLGPAFKKGDIIITADIGCGTADFVANQLEDDISLDCRFRTLGHSSGDICGSAQVDRVLREWLLNKMSKKRGWSARTAMKLGVTPRDFVRRTLDAMAKVKEAFKETDVSRIGVIQGMDDRYESFAVPRDEMRKAMDHVLVDIIRMINEQIKSDQFPHAIIVTGGFSASGYAMKRLREEYEPRGIVVVRPSDTDQTACFPVAKGALLRYKNVMDQHLPEKYGYAILQRHVFDEANPAHADSWTKDGMTGEVEYRPWVKASPIDCDVDVVEDRIHTIIAQGEMASEIPHINMQFHVPVNNPNIEAEFVCLSKNFDHGAASQRLQLPGEHFEEGYTTHDDVHKWRTVRMELPRDKLEAYDFKQVTAEDGEKCWLLNVVVVVRKSDHGMGIEFKILKPQPEVAVKVEDESEEAHLNAVFEGEVAFRVKDAAVWDGKHSPFTED